MTEIKANLISSDGRVFTIDKEVGMQSELLRDRLEYVDENDNENISLPNVSGNTLEKVIEYCEHHRNDSTDKYIHGDKYNDDWDKEYIKRLTPNEVLEVLYEVILAANYMNIKPLLDLTCGHVAKIIKGKKLEELRALFNIENVSTPEEEEEIKRENE